MKARGLEDSELRAISPAALAAWARAAGWKKTGAYGEFADIYAAAGLPEIVLPRTSGLADYALVAEQIIGCFARAAGADELAVYRDLLEADRDAVRVRAGGGRDGAMALDDAVALLGGARAMLVAVARSLSQPRAFYRTRPDGETMAWMKRVQVGQDGEGSRTVLLLMPRPPAPPTRPGGGGAGGREPFERRATRRLADALEALSDISDASGDAVALFRLEERGVSANLCEALAGMADPFPTLDIVVTWARADDDAPPPARFRFARGHALFLRDAARLFRDSDAG